MEHLPGMLSGLRTDKGSTEGVLQTSRLLAGICQLPTTSHTKHLKAKNLPAQGQQRSGGVCLPTCCQVGSVRGAVSEHRSRGFVLGEESMQGSWLLKPLLNSCG